LSEALASLKVNLKITERWLLSGSRLSVSSHSWFKSILFKIRILFLKGQWKIRIPKMVQFSG
jgi:hypothetical protein